MHSKLKLFEFFFMNQKIDKEKPVLVAGDPERASMKKCDDKNGISYHINQIKYAVNSFLF